MLCLRCAGPTHGHRKSSFHISPSHPTPHALTSRCHPSHPTNSPRISLFPHPVLTISPDMASSSTSFSSLEFSSGSVVNDSRASNVSGSPSLISCREDVRLTSTAGYRGHQINYRRKRTGDVGPCQKCSNDLF